MRIFPFSLVLLTEHTLKGASAMKKIRTYLCTVLIFTLLALSFASCGAEASKGDTTVHNEMVMEESSSDMMSDMAPSMDAADVELQKTEGSTNQTESNPNTRKIIETVSLSLQTKNFDTLMQDLEDKIAALGGYVEQSEIWGNAMNSERNRSAQMTVRIPTAKSGSFTGFVSENAVVTNRSVSTEDVTLAYVDMESRVSALEAEREALENILKNAVSVEDVIKIRSSLTDVIYEIEAIKSKLRTYDNLVDYTTVSLHIYEVDRTAVVEEQSVWQEIGTNWKNNTADLWEFFVSLFVFFVSSLPFLIPLFIVLAVLILLARKRKKHKEAKPSAPSDSSK